MCSLRDSQKMIALGDEFLSKGQLNEALNIFESLLPHYNDKVRFTVNYKIGKCYYLLSDITKAEHYWIAAQTLQTERPEIILSLATIDFFRDSLLGDYKFRHTLEKIERVEFLLNSASDEENLIPKYLSLKARINMEMGRTTEVEAIINRLSAQYPEHPASQITLARFLQYKNDFEKAYQIYERLILHNAIVQTAYEGLAHCALRLNAAKKAQDVLEHCARSFPSLHFAHYWLGWLNWKVRDYPSARVSLSRTIELCPTHAYGHYYLGCTLLKLFKPTIAVNHFDVSAKIQFSYVGKPTLDYCYSVRGAAIANLMRFHFVQGFRLAWMSLTTMQKIFLDRIRAEET